MIVAMPHYPGEGRKKHYLELLAKAMTEAGHTLKWHEYHEAPPKGVDFAVFWGMKGAIRPKAQSARIPFLVSEMPYFGSRSAWASLGWNHLGRAAIRPEPGELARPQPRLRPWTEAATGTIIVFGQTQRDYATRDIDIEEWAAQRCVQAHQHWKRPVHYRPHPHILRNSGDERPWGTEEALEKARAWMAVTYTSTAAVKSVSYGVPTVAEHPESVAWDVCSHDVTMRIKPDREAWAHWLSYCQWSEQEFADGTALRHVMLAYDAAKADAESR